MDVVSIEFELGWLFKIEVIVVKSFSHRVLFQMRTTNPVTEATIIDRVAAIVLEIGSDTHSFITGTKAPSVQT